MGGVSARVLRYYVRVISYVLTFEWCVHVLRGVLSPRPCIYIILGADFLFGDSKWMVSGKNGKLDNIFFCLCSVCDVSHFSLYSCSLSVHVSWILFDR